MAAEPPPPPPKKKRRDDDEDDEADPKTGASVSKTTVYVAVLGSMFLAMSTLGVLGYFLFTNLDTSDSAFNRVARQQTNQQQQQKEAPKNTKFDLTPVPGEPSPIRPPADVPPVITFNTEVGAIAAGGGGRFILMHFPKEGQLGLFDANTAKVTRVAADNGEVRLVAGLNRAVLYSTGATMFRVYSLPDLKKLSDSNAPKNFSSIAMGALTNGPLVGVENGNIHLLSVQDDGVKEIADARKDGIGLHNGLQRASADGRLYLTFDNFEKGDVRLATEENREWKKMEGKHVYFPGLDGLLYGNGQVADRTGKNVPVGGVGPGSGNWFVPAASVTENKRQKRVVNVSIHTDRNSEVPAAGTTPLSGPELDGLLEMHGENVTASRGRPLDHHLFLLPEAKLLVIIDKDKKKMYLKRAEF
jgi:hypothetical protein